MISHIDGQVYLVGPDGQDASVRLPVRAAYDDSGFVRIESSPWLTVDRPAVKAVLADVDGNELATWRLSDDAVPGWSIALWEVRP